MKKVDYKKVKKFCEEEEFKFTNKYYSGNHKYFYFKIVKFMNKEDFDKVESFCKKEGFKIINESHNDNEKFFVICKNDIWKCFNLS